MFRENKTRTRISYEDNTKIIALIKSKINPLHSKVENSPYEDKLLPSIKIRKSLS